MHHFQAHQVFFKPKTKMAPTHQVSNLKVIPLRKSPIFDPFVVRKNVKGS